MQLLSKDYEQRVEQNRTNQQIRKSTDYLD